MKQIIPFEKEITFRTMIGEITSISLEHTLALESETTIRGDFIVSGTYKMTEASQLEENFEHRLPVDIEIANHYDIKNSKIEIDDFYYEIINDDVLKVNIDVLLDGVEVELSDQRSEEETVEPEEIEVEIERDEGEEMIENEILLPQSELPNIEEHIQEEVIVPEPKTIVTQEVKEEPKAKQVEMAPSLNSIFSCFKDSDETFSTYSVYIVRENDTLEEIMDRYHTTREDLANYNNLDEISLGCKLIIPCSPINHS